MRKNNIKNLAYTMAPAVVALIFLWRHQSSRMEINFIEPSILAYNLKTKNGVEVSMGQGQLIMQLFNNMVKV